MVWALMCLEHILNAVNMNFVTFSDFFDSRQIKGNIFSCNFQCYWTNVLSLSYLFVNFSTSKIF